eukprot:gene1135-1506_t
MTSQQLKESEVAVKLSQQVILANYDVSQLSKVSEFQPPAGRQFSDAVILFEAIYGNSPPRLDSVMKIAEDVSTHIQNPDNTFQFMSPPQIHGVERLLVDNVFNVWLFLERLGMLEEGTDFPTDSEDEATSIALETKVDLMHTAWGKIEDYMSTLYRYARFMYSMEGKEWDGDAHEFWYRINDKPKKKMTDEW